MVDNSQAVIIGADVVATNMATSARRATTTNDDGAFRFDLLPVGTYTVKITKPGFSAQAQI